MGEDCPRRNEVDFGKRKNVGMNTRVWTWAGKYFGYIEEQNLWTRDGRHVGSLHGEEIYNRDGKYLGEVKIESRLITATNKKGLLGPSFTSLSRRASGVPAADRTAYMMYLDYEDFPLPENL